MGGVQTLRPMADPTAVYFPPGGKTDPEFMKAFEGVANGPTLEARQAAFVQAQKIGVEHVLDMDAKSVLRARIGLQDLGQIPVDFDHVQPLDPLEQSPCQGAASRPDLYQPLAGERRHSVYDPPDHPRVVQKVLAEALTNRH